MTATHDEQGSTADRGDKTIAADRATDDAAESTPSGGFKNPTSASAHDAAPYPESIVTSTYPSSPGVRPQGTERPVSGEAQLDQQAQDDAAEGEVPDGEYQLGSLANPGARSTESGEKPSILKEAEQSGT